MPAWVVWLVVAAVLGIAEVTTLTFALGLMAIGALVAAVAASAGLPVVVQMIAFGATSAAGLAAVRPIALRHVRQPPLLRSGTAALVGREALALTEVSRYAGRVRIGGEEWTARPYDPGVVIPEGAAVDVLAIEGVTALVHPQEDPWPTSP
ncbi:NfeD family protein [Actinoallomurus purpureus]|uniref:NfeD family protein n=1 Tax=Actinoallomurus purpureus TaxID=478114 RepID=UPI0020927303|nr:NfeD family protein [Actinoallomurus purpureus]MCO6009364.1 NfeD family protein [Actinoallomurus purpureus]